MSASPPRVSHRAKMIGLTLLCFALGSQALTLGRVQGVALLGQALNVVVPVQLDASEEASALCFEAEVFHADTRQAASGVRVRVEARPQATELRIQSSTPIDEPVVTVYLRSGCAGQKTTRRYVLLTDIPVEVASPALPSVPPPAPAPAAASALPVVLAPVTAPTTAARSSPAPRAKASRAAPAGPRSLALGKRGAAMSAAAPKAAAPQPGKAERPAGQARLQLDPLEFLSDRIANLEAPAPVTQAQDALRNIQRMEALEGSVKTLLASAAQSETRLADLKVRLQKAESERFPPAVVYTLLALLLACLLALAWLWRRQRKARAGTEPWWSDSLYVPAAEAQPPAAEPEATPEPARKSDATPAVAAAPALDVDLMDGGDSGFDLFLPAPTPEPPVSMPEPAAPLPALTPAPARELNFETRLDIRQQAEFLVSLGQADQAVHILMHELDPDAAPNPFVCLDLLKLVHALGQRAEFEALRRLFQQHFNARVPEFERFADPGRDLEAYPELLARITALWPTPEVLGVIDASLAAQDGSTQPYDLAAYRELLLLHTLAHGLAAQTDLDLDLNLLASSPASATASVDVPLDDIPAPAESGNLIEFELPSTPPAQR